jgi:hypothetical protein
MEQQSKTPELEFTWYVRLLELTLAGREGLPLSGPAEVSTVLIVPGYVRSKRADLATNLGNIDRRVRETSPGEPAHGSETA